MQTKIRRRKSPFLLLSMLIAFMMLLITGCNNHEKEAALSDLATETEAGEANATDVQVLGEGNVSFTLIVTDKEGTDTQFEIHTDKETVGEALKELALIDGEEGEYGLYVKTVNGITVDYDKDGVYWAFYINGEYALSGVDATAIVEENSYAFKVE